MREKQIRIEQEVSWEIIKNLRKIEKFSKTIAELLESKEEVLNSSSVFSEVEK